MALTWSAVERGNIWTCTVQRLGMSKDAGNAAVTALANDAVNMLLLPNPANWNEVMQCAVAAKRKAAGQTPVVLTLLELLGL